MAIFRMALVSALVAGAPAAASTPRELLTLASFATADRATALTRIEAAQASAGAVLRRTPNDREAAMMQATALGYRAKLTGSRSEALAARKLFETLVARDPGNAEAQLALGAWHVSAVNKLGRLFARAALGAQRPAGFAALDRAVALGGDRAMFSGLAALLRIKSDPADPRGRQLAEAATRGATPTALDRILQRAASQILVPLRAGQGTRAQALASRLLPLGQLGD